MTEEEAILFLQKTEQELYYIEQELGEDEMGNEVLDEITKENIPGCDFKYKLNDSIFILCTREGIHGGEFDTTLVCLNSFTLHGEMVDRTIIGEKIYYGDIQAIEKFSSFVLLDEKNIKVYYYEKNNSKGDDNYLSSVYFVNCEITPEGRFNKKEKSRPIRLKQQIELYLNYNSKQEDDPMNEYDF
jgi:hypothetical protein